MHNKRWNPALGLGLILAAALACNYSFSTANISSVKLSKDKSASSETSTFAPTDTVYVVAQLSNTSEKWKMRCRLLYDDVKGQKSGEMVSGSEQSVDLEGAGTATYTYRPLGGGAEPGKYKAEVSMLNDKGEQKDQKTASFEVTRGANRTPPGGNQNSSNKSGDEADDNSSSDDDR
jgi:hypothetical protein